MNIDTTHKRNLATELGVVIPSPWLTWFKAAVLPAALGLIINPFLLYKVREQSDIILG